MNRRSDQIFNEQNKNESAEQSDDFTASCKPLSELLDSVRNIEGFPLGKDEDILSLSDPPYYTACPNPYINEFIERYGKPYDETTDTYERTPFVSDVSEGKNDPIYNAHSYHTKVPHKAIIPFIEHYTKPGDIVFDGFCGTGMTGVAAQLTGRKAILCDLSPAATFIAYNYNTPVDVKAFEKEAKRILDEVEKECGWMYETVHTDGKTRGKINYIVWSDVFKCPYCNNEYIFWDVAVNKKEGTVLDDYACPHCNAVIGKRESERAVITLFDTAINQEVTQVKQVPVLVNYSTGRGRFEKTPSKEDLDLVKRIEESTTPHWFPTNPMMCKGERWGDTWRAGVHFGITHVHHFYTKRNLLVLAELRSRCTSHQTLLWFNSQLINISKLNRYRPGVSFPYNPLSGTLYIGSQVSESNVFVAYENKLKKLIQAFKDVSENSLIFISSSEDSSIVSASIDYIFTDPPFGSNLMYSELNFLWEAWLKVLTNNRSEAIINETQHKDLNEYKRLMTECFKEMYRILKPNRWITVVFHNSKAAVWNAIQDSLVKAGFVVAQVTILDKKVKTFKQVTAAGAVKNDLVINAYKPKKHFEEYFLKRAGEGLERDFVEEHLKHLPVEPNLERTEQMLFSKMLAHYLKHGFEIRLNAKQFYTLLRDNFKLIEGYWFTDKQVLKYEEWKKKQGISKIKEIKSGYEVLFINDEKSAIIWLYNFLETPQSYSDIYTSYSKATSSIEDKIPELKDLLSNNFIFEDKVYRRPKTEKEQEAIEEQREKDLNKAFEQILLEAKTSGKKLKEIRKEAISYGFTKAYQQMRFEDIVTVAKKLDRKILEENSEINDFVEIAQLKLGVEV
ncbi:MAG TPA: DNA methyltransferase [Paludibacter sp.]|nr:DNA methyltransferase [Paludibacter sp.]